jgi:hypothetical protein
MKFKLFRAILFSFLFLVPGRASDPELTLTHNGADAAVSLSGDDGVEYLLEAAIDAAQDWNVLGSFILNDQTRLWTQPTATSGAQFFRARTLVQSDDRYASNFGLLDQNGVRRELFYYVGLQSLKAVVLIFTEGNYPAFASKINALRANSLFKDSVFFWTIESSPDSARTSIVRDAIAAGLVSPVLHDPIQMTAHDYKARFNGEVVVIRMADIKVVYRGLIDDATAGAPPTREFLAMALTNIVASDPLTISRIEPSQNRLSEINRPIADYATVIAPLLQNKCVTCHSPGNIAPFALTNYDSVVEHAAEMKEHIADGHMPPWHADPEYGKFKNDISLSTAQKAMLVDWLDAGLPRTGEDDPLTNVPPPPPAWPKELGPPDQVIAAPIQYLPATGVFEYRYAYVRATNTTDRWLRAAIIRPSNPAAVHHYNVWEGHVPTALVLAAYSPGRTESAYPEGTGWFLRAGMEMTIEIHYTATGQEETDEPKIALWYADSPPALALKGAAAQNSGFQIPPGNGDYEVTASQVFSQPVRLYMVNPHMHLRGSRMRFELTVPGQPKRIIASIPHYDFHWQTVYHFDPPLDLPANSRIDAIGAFDNSPLNPHNPDPTAFIRWGNQSWDEMFIGYMEYSNLP